MIIDFFTHILSPRYRDALDHHFPGGLTKRFVQTRALWDLEQRLRIMDQYGDYVQVLSFSVPPLEAITSPGDAAELAYIGNNELAELIAKYPDRFIAGVANLPMNNIDAALRETDRAIKGLGLKGILVYSNINGKPLDSPEFMPIYEKMAHYDLPIWIHPRRDATVPDYATESSSKYMLHGALGWPYETELAMCRLVCSGVLEHYPNLSFITHHCGGGIPYLEHRLHNWLGAAASRDPGSTLGKLTKPPLEYLRMFYGDTALNGNIPALMCGYAFFGAEHVVFATDMPFGAEHTEHGNYPIEEGIRSVKEMDIPDSKRRRILEDNANRLLHLLT